MNKKGQTMGMILGVFMMVLVGVVLFQASAQNIGEVRDTVTLANDSLSSNADNNTLIYYTDYKKFENVVIYNETGNVLIPAANYTVTNNVVYNGALAVSINPDVSSKYQYKWQVSATAYPTTYDDSSGGRALAGIIVILFAMAIAVVTLQPTLRSKVLGNMR